MRRHARRSAALLLAGVFLAGGCAGGEETDDLQAELDREMELAMGDTGLAELADVPSEEPEPDPQPARTQPRPRTTAPSQPAPRTPAPQPSGPRYESLTVPAGTSFQVTLNQELSTRNNQVGDIFTTSVDAPIVVDGRVAIPAGAVIRGEVTAVQKSGGAGQEAVLKVAFDEVSFEGETYPVQLTITEANPTTKGRSSTGEKAAKIGAGAAAGAILGRVIGGDAKGTIIGGVLGGAAGTAIVLGTEDVDAVLAQGSRMTVRLDAPVVVQKQVS